MLGFLRSAFGLEKASGASSNRRSQASAVATAAANHALRAMVDVHNTNADNEKLFKSAVDNWHADATVRRDIRKKARYECLNNSYVRGMVKTKQVDLIGTGPRLHILSEDREAAAEVEMKVTQWMEDIQLASKLRSMIFEWFTGGEAFAMLRTNPASPNPVKLDLQVLDAEQIPDESDGEKLLEGITYDDFGNAISYKVLPRHPAGESVMGAADARDVPARFICHIFNADRSSQVRGLSEFTSSLLPAALLRSFTLAVVKAANIAASLSFVVHTDEIGEDSTACEPYDVIDLEHGTGMALPDGYKATQFKAEQPVDTYSDFKNEMLNEVGRGVLMPRLKVSGDASNYNYSSGRLDGQEYNHACDVERREIELVTLRKLFAEWWLEAKSLKGYLSPAAKALVEEGAYPAYPRHRWGWDGRPHVDPQKEATADQTKLANGSMGLHDVYAALGKNAEDEMTKSARILGLTIDEYREKVVASIFQTAGGTDVPEDDGGEDDSRRKTK